ncbi:MAG: hypothetical protein A2X19_05425 [Bacteroidetes bacterium GWE2_39_28]|nr:MAG: hypothetical protein A2X19_05425 [Bacteroidetes bacterium GWE2_39_28]OFY15208.1 MAG: hypothetical protein A2X16_08675 [Bacteroidetes bacterium GWF2_39_10]OFZ06952.1 MAG: hypothetical protein A2322_08640 [Bacteroidetes bacterium RIFOXYB2_FULL_39_7]OFZ09617.1 MAG: hypothetical protein A2465_08825 [Bacteroidetes bacterium RIFOXYC2_FULL_39_11]HCT93836.1 hypothetical protein [Rikenellaceae bacterium]
MITKMDKYSFIVFHSDLTPFLESLQGLGMVDITRDNKAVDTRSKELFDLSIRYNRIIKKLKSTIVESSDGDSSVKKSEESYFNEFSDLELLEKAELSFLNKEQWEQEGEQLRRELYDSSVWGALHKEDLEKIAALGYKIHLFSVSEKSFKPQWEQDYAIHILNEINGKIYFIILSYKDEEFQFEIPESKQPSMSFDIVEEKIAELKIRTEQNNTLITSLTGEIERLEIEAKKVGSDLDLYLAGAASLKEAEDTIAVLTGFAPSDNKDVVREFLDNEQIYYLTEDAVKEDNPPIKLKNGFFSRLYEPIGDLYMLPKYGETDLTPYFAPFYMLFFGLCLGDMGYGLVLLIGAGLAKLKFPKFRSYLTLVQFLGLGAVLMALLPGVIFGAKLQDIFHLPVSVNELFFSDLKMFWFAIIFGLVQIVFARMLNAVTSIIKNGWQYGMHNIGWSIVIIWAAFKYASTMVPELIIPAFANYIAIAGALLILFFSEVKGNILVRLAKGGLAFYDITSIFGDMLSYIRLFGLGTAGAILGMVVNSVAMSMVGIPYLGWLFAGIMLLVGHIAVLALSSLGAFVHPMRLTFVEFYKNASFSGGGRAFRPLVKDKE